MKAKLLVLAMTAMALGTSCSNDEVTEMSDSNAIKFNVVAGKATRAGAAATTTSTIDNFKVWGYLNGTAAAYMDGVEVSKESDGQWKYSPLQFWPSSALTFYSVSPSTISVTTTSAGYSTAPTIDSYVVTDGSVDLLYAVNAGVTKPTDGKMTVNFRHALSQIVFKAQNTNTELEVDINGVKVVNVLSTNTFTYPNQSTSPQVTTTDGTITTGTQGNWGTTATTKKTYEAGITEAEEISSTGVELTSATGALFLLPQAITAWDHTTQTTVTDTNGSYFLVSCKIRNANTDTYLYGSASEYKEVAVPITAITWEQGKKYIYTFKFNDNGGYNPPGEPQPGEPVLVPISFDVTVDVFVNGTDDTTLNM